MRKTQEVEVKYPLYNPENVIERLKKIESKKTLDNKHQSDFYFTPTSEDFFAKDIVSEWLRIRVVDEKNIMCYKRARVCDGQTYHDEYEVYIDDLKSMELILQAVNIHKTVCVEKTRSSWLLNDIEVSIDFVRELGFYIELEKTKAIDIKDLSVVYAEFQEVLNMLEANVGIRELRGYPSLIKNI